MAEPAAGSGDQATTATKPTSTRSTLVNGLRWAAIVVVVVAAVWQLRGEWDEFRDAVLTIPWHSSLLAQLAVIGSMAATVWGWQLLIDDMGKPIGYRTSAQIYLVGQLGKYVPGSVWGYLLQIELGKKAGLARARVFVATLVHLGVVLVSAMVVGLIALPVIYETSPLARWMLLFIPLGLVAMHPIVLTWVTSLALRILRRPPLDHTLSLALIGRVLGASGIAKVLHGLHLWLLANSVGAPGWTGLLLCIGAMSLAMTAGTVAFVLPAGVGAREVVIVAVLTTAGIGWVEASALAVVSRVMFLIGDIVTAGAAALAARLQLRV